MRVAIPHGLGREEVRRRMHARVGELAGFIPGGMAQVEPSWPSEDHMDLVITAMGQQVGAKIDIEDAQVVCHIDLPPALSFIEPLVQGAVEKTGRKLLT
ncbi:polyhydroxyalkanoic acid system family protein [Novosphingobium sp.]|uniref:polyhydroxyalkanoic acid system family protein n=1 Tax=Novosphingobium sp. TaxID=1874826 RepID=UPI00286DCF9A|nr:polyhydroxyalkanoic acid system family protein [Novosphingobium sp.]